MQGEEGLLGPANQSSTTHLARIPVGPAQRQPIEKKVGYYSSWSNENTKKTKWLVSKMHHYVDRAENMQSESSANK